MLWAQRDLESQANKYYEAGKYQEALDLYNKVSPEKEMLMRKGIAAYHAGQYDQSLNYLIDSYSQGYRNKLLYKYVGDSYNAKGDFEKATKFYKSYISELSNDDPERYATLHKIKRCGYAKDYKYADQIAFVENLGASVNTSFDEFTPLQSPGNPNKYYFSSNRSNATGGLRASDGTKDDVYGSYLADMYAVESINGVWTPVSGIDAILNSAKNDILQDFSPTGGVMYFLRTSGYSDDQLLTDTFKLATEEIQWPKEMSSPIVAKLGDRDVRVFNADTYIFASMREGGYGGYDLYIATRDAEGVWNEPINLGPEVNSAFDEICPFATLNGNKLYFSSNRLNSMGGYDVYTTDYGLETNTWSAPMNLGVPVNSSKDDLYFRLNRDAITGVLSSNRMGSLGGFDIYNVYFKNEIVEHKTASKEMPFVVFSNMEEVPQDSTIVAYDETASDSIYVEPTPEELIEEPTAEESISNKYVGVELREVSLAPLYYQSSENIFNPQNVKQLNKLVETMTIYPEVQVMLTGHAVQEGLPEFDLYFSAKRAEKVAEHIMSRGIAKDRILLRGVGTAYPAADPTNYIQSNKYNRRVDMRLIVPEGVPVSAVSARNPIPDGARDMSIKQLNAFDQGLKYKIHIAQTQQMYKDPIIRSAADAMIERSSTDNAYQYSIGMYDRYNQARSALLRLSNRPDFTRISIQPYIDGVALPAHLLAKYAPMHPDLQSYIRYEQGE